MQELESPAGPGAMAPNLSHGAGAALLSWLEPAADGAGMELFTARLSGEGWESPQRVAAGETFFANWADLPAAVEAGGGLRFAHWLDKLGSDTYAYGARLARSLDGGGWQPLGLLHDDASPTEHGFVSYAATGDGAVQAFWLDGREMLGGGAMQLRTAAVDADGPSASVVLDERVCECCSTDAAITSTGAVVAFRDRSEDEIRDIAVVRAVGDGWSEPAVVHRDGWQIRGCPVNGPAIAARGERVAVAWFTAAAPGPRVFVAFSSDGGASFGAPVVIDDAGPPGRVDIELDAEGGAVVSWLAAAQGAAQGAAEIRWRRVAADGRLAPAQRLATTAASRSAGVPRMVRVGDELLFVWVDVSGPQSVLRSARVALG